jgi:hypothetical protein
MTKILRVKKLPIYDVFEGEGWFNWTRVAVRSNKLKVVGGNPLNMGQKEKVLQEVRIITKGE